MAGDDRAHLGWTMAKQSEPNECNRAQKVEKAKRGRPKSYRVRCHILYRLMRFQVESFTRRHMQGTMGFNAQQACWRNGLRHVLM